MEDNKCSMRLESKAFRRKGCDCNKYMLEDMQFELSF